MARYRVGVDQAAAAEKLLAERRRSSVGTNPDESLVHYAEVARSGDWTLRSALVRLAQPEPTRAAAVLELTRWCDGALHQLSIHLENQDGAIEPDAVPEEVLPILVAVLELDQLAGVLATWAQQGPSNPPLETVDATCSRVYRLLDDADVPRDTGPPGRGRR